MKWLVLSLLAARVALGAPAGNGGDAVLCRNGDGSVKSLEFFDFFEARALGKDALDFPVGHDVHEIFAALLQRLERVAPRRAERYAAQAQEFFTRGLFLPDTRLIDVPDYDVSLLPAGCGVEQIVVQQVPALPEDRRFIVNKDLWDLLSETDKAGLLMHEMILQEALEPQRFSHADRTPFTELVYVDSRKVRALNQIVWAQSFASRDVLNFLQTLGVLYFQRGEYAGVELALFDYIAEDYKYYELRPPGEGVSRPSYTLHVGSRQLASARAFSGSTVRVADAEPKVVAWTHFYPSGKLQSFYPCSDFRLSAWPGPVLDVVTHLNASCQIGGSDYESEQYVSLYETGTPRRLKAKVNDLHLTSPTYDVIINGGQWSEGVARLEFRQDAALLSASGHIRGVATRGDKRVSISGRVVELYPSGLLKHVAWAEYEYFTELLQGKELRFLGDVSFYEGGQLWKARLGQPARLKTTTNELKAYQRGNSLEFDAGGLVIKGES